MNWHVPPMQTSDVHGTLSLQGSRVPAREIFTQISPVVQGSPSSQLVPFGSACASQLPVELEPDRKDRGRQADPAALPTAGARQPLGYRR